MDIAISNPSILSKKLSDSKTKVLELLSKRIDSAKLNILKEYFKENNIIFSNNIIDLQEFISKEVSKLDSKRKNEVDIILKNSTTELQKLINELKSGSTNAFRNFLTNTYSNLIKPVTKGAAVALAERTALIMAPTLESKLAVGSIIAAHMTYNLVKNNKYKNIANQNYECNIILQELETTKDQYGRIIDTRFNKYVQDTIITFLKANNIEFENTGYLSLRECIYNLDLYNRIALANVINNMTGNKIDVNKRISKYDRNIREKLKASLKPITSLTGLGLGAAAAINQVESTALAAPANGLALGTLVSKLSNSPVVGWITGIIGGLGTIGTRLIPYAGEFFDKIYKIENFALLGSLGLLVGIGGLIGTKIYKSIKSIVYRKNNSKDQKLISQIDQKLYEKDNIDEYQKIFNRLQDKGYTVEELAILGIVKTYAKEKNIRINDNISTIEELKLEIQKSDSRDKSKILKLLNALDDYNVKDKNAFRRVIKKIGKALYWTATFGLAGLSVWDIISGGEFLTGLSEKVFANTKGLLKKMSPVSREDYAPYSHETNSEDLPPLNNVNPSSTISPEPEIKPEPAPAPTMQPSVTSPPEIEDTTFIDALNNTKEFATDVSKMSTEEAYKTLAKIGNNGLLSECVNKLDNNAIKGLVNYMNTSPNIDSKSIPYKMIENLINGRVKEINDYIETVRRTTEGLVNISVPVIASVNADTETSKEM